MGEDWVKFHTDMLDDPKLLCREEWERLFFKNLILLARTIHVRDSSVPPGVISGFTITLLKNRFVMKAPPKKIQAALAYFAAGEKPMVRLGPAERITLVNYEKRQSVKGAAPERERAMQVYFILNARTECIKFGTSKNPWARLTKLREHSQDELVLVSTIKASDETESMLLSQFAAQRQDGDWYEPIPALMKIVNGAATLANHAPAVMATNEGSRDGVARGSHGVARLQQEGEGELEGDLEREIDKKQKPFREGEKQPSLPLPGHSLEELSEDWEPDLLKGVRIAVTSTRNGGKMADGPWRAFLLRAAQFPRPQREAAARVYLERRYAAQGKGEKYLVGMMRGEAGMDYQPTRVVGRRPNEPLPPDSHEDHSADAKRRTENA